MEQKTKSQLEFALNILFSVTHHSEVSICRYCLTHIEGSLDKRATLTFDTFPHNEEYDCVETKREYESLLEGELREESRGDLGVFEEWKKCLWDLHTTNSSLNYLIRAIETALECEDRTMADDLLRACVEKVKNE